ncbi:MAG: hypothetical protein ACOX6T_15750 [Myxococcales bacterium]
MSGKRSWAIAQTEPKAPAEMRACIQAASCLALTTANPMRSSFSAMRPAAVFHSVR